RRRGDGGGRDRAKDRREWLGRRDRGSLGASAGQTAADASLAAAPPGRRYRLVCAARAIPRAGGGPGRTDPPRERLPGSRAAAVRLPDPFRHGQPALGGAIPPGERPTALVPGGLGRGPARLAHLPGGP